MRREYRTMDSEKATWGDGPWLAEPDKIVWVDEATSLDCMVKRNRYGALCGYVGVGPGHPLHGLDYDAAHSRAEIDVHGSLTYADACEQIDGEDESVGICHVPEPGRPHDVWWFGFDCGHSMDRSPGREARERAMGWNALPYEERSRYRTVAYVEGEIARLAEQLAGVA